MAHNPNRPTRVQLFQVPRDESPQMIQRWTHRTAQPYSATNMANELVFRIIELSCLAKLDDTGHADWVYDVDDAVLTDAFDQNGQLKPRILLDFPYEHRKPQIRFNFNDDVLFVSRASRAYILHVMGERGCFLHHRPAWRADKNDMLMKLNPQSVHGPLADCHYFDFTWQGNMQEHPPQRTRDNSSWNGDEWERGIAWRRNPASCRSA